MNSINQNEQYDFPVGLLIDNGYRFKLQKKNEKWITGEVINYDANKPRRITLKIEKTLGHENPYFDYSESVMLIDREGTYVWCRIMSCRADEIDLLGPKDLIPKVAAQVLGTANQNKPPMAQNIIPIDDVVNQIRLGKPFKGV